MGVLAQAGALPAGRAGSGLASWADSPEKVILLVVVGVAILAGVFWLVQKMRNDS